MVDNSTFLTLVVSEPRARAGGSWMLDRADMKRKGRLTEVPSDVEEA